MMKKGETPLPAYYRLQTAIQDKIESGRWKPGEPIATERGLAETHQVSIGTVKKALLNLVHEGYLYRVQGKGTFVAGTTLRRESLRYYRLMERFSGPEIELKVRFMKLKRVKGAEPARTFLKTEGNQNLFALERLFFSGNTSLIYNISYLPEGLFSGLDQIPQARFETTPLYLLLEEKYRLPTLYNRELFSAAIAEPPLAGILRVKKGTPLLHIEMLAYTYRDTPYEYRRAYCLTRRRRVFRKI